MKSKELLYATISELGFDEMQSIDGGGPSAWDRAQALWTGVGTHFGCATSLHPSPPSNNTSGLCNPPPRP